MDIIFKGKEAIATYKDVNSLDYNSQERIFESHKNATVVKMEIIFIEGISLEHAVNEEEDDISQLIITVKE